MTNIASDEGWADTWPWLVVVNKVLWAPSPSSSSLHGLQRLCHQSEWSQQRLMACKLKRWLSGPVPFADARSSAFSDCVLFIESIIDTLRQWPPLKISYLFPSCGSYLIFGVTFPVPVSLLSGRSPCWWSGGPELGLLHWRCVGVEEAAGWGVPSHRVATNREHLKVTFKHYFKTQHIVKLAWDTDSGSESSEAGGPSVQQAFNDLHGSHRRAL